ncbi:hypothetical protein SCLCIDRAFT_856466 [Scleroderma citrinum Foug A]|uniref:Uncharacterized protein n=1 Tax=Scleroderma citrinum Foug A TaxID=1036808 RepID=A0A0C3DZZ0_9AGAM|nr:hypothetical protein SCLCIDRAFT_856466 [Scleroderma citrinum Foug A]
MSLSPCPSSFFWSLHPVSSASEGRATQVLFVTGTIDGYVGSSPSGHLVIYKSNILIACTTYKEYIYSSIVHRHFVVIVPPTGHLRHIVIATTGRCVSAPSSCFRAAGHALSPLS